MQDIRFISPRVLPPFLSSANVLPFSLGRQPTLSPGLVGQPAAVSFGETPTLGTSGVVFGALHATPLSICTDHRGFPFLHLGVKIVPFVDSRFVQETDELGVGYGRSADIEGRQLDKMFWPLIVGFAIVTAHRELATGNEDELAQARTENLLATARIFVLDFVSCRTSIGIGLMFSCCCDLCRRTVADAR
jgi:hypothetical protein